MIKKSKESSIIKHISVANPIFSGNEKKYLNECIDTGWVSSLGKFINKFEKQFSDYCNTKYGVAVTNGTAALHLLLESLNITDGDEVIVPDLTFVATANAVSYTGAKPVFVDSELDTWNISPQFIEEKITLHTKAIIAVHLYGQPCDMTELVKLSKKYNLFLIEDCAEAHGAEFCGRKVGSFGQAGCFSFYGNKIITCGEGGLIVTDDYKLLKKILFLRDHAMSAKKRYYHPSIGFNYRMTNLQAAVGLAQLEQINEILKIKFEIEEEYIKNLSCLENLEFQKKLNNRKKICWLFSMLVKSVGKKNRNGLMRFLLKNNIDSRPFFIPMTKLPPYFNSKIINKNALFLSETGINLPTSINLTSKQISYICEKIKLYFAN